MTILHSKNRSVNLTPKELNLTLFQITFGPTRNQCKIYSLVSVKFLELILLNIE